MAPKQAPKRTSPEVEPPSASSTSSEEDDQLTDNEQEQNHDQEAPKETAQSGSSDEEEDEEEEEEEQVQNDKPSVQKPTPTTPTTTTKTPRPNSPSDSGSDSESDSAQPSPTASDFTIQPIASKPMENPKNPTSKPSSAKRPATTEANGEKNAKKKKAKVEEVEEKKSGGGSHNRLWSDDDETVILKGMADFEKEKGADPSAYMGAFHAFIKESLSVEVSRGQLVDKVRRLKKKYAGKGENGEDPVFSKPHENKCFELSKKVWGGGRKVSSNGVVEENGFNGKSGNKKSEDSLALQPKENGEVVVDFKGEMKDVKVDDFWSAYPFLKQSMDTEVASGLSMKEPVYSFMVENMSLIGQAKAKELEKKWKSLKADETALYLKRVDLIREQTKLVLDAKKYLKD